MIPALSRSVRASWPTTSHHGWRVKPALSGTSLEIIERVFPAVIQAKHRARIAVASRKHGARAHRAARIAFLIGEVDLEAVRVLIADPRLGELGISPVPEPRYVPGEHVVLHFAFDDPLRHHQAHAAQIARSRG